MNLITTTICILSWNRKNDILISLSHIFTIIKNNGKYEVILVDNSSTDGTIEAVQKEFPTVIIVRNENNGIEGWNRAFSIAHGKYLLILDNDAHPDSKALDKIERVFDTHEDIDIIACNILVQKKQKYLSANRFIETGKNSLTEVFDFIGCGVAMRKEVISTIGGFASYIFMYGHETEFSLRALRANLKIYFTPEIIVYHRISEASRSTNLGVEYMLSNFIIISWIYFPILYALNVTIEILLEMLLLAVINNNLLAYSKGIKRVIKMRGQIALNRRPLTWKLLQSFDKHFPFTIKAACKRIVGLM